MNRNPKAEVLLLENQHELKINGKKDAGSQCIEIMTLGFLRYKILCKCCPYADNDKKITNNPTMGQHFQEM